MKTGLSCASDDGQQLQLLPFTSQAAAAAADNHSHSHCQACKHKHCPEIHFDEVIFPASCMTLWMVLQLPLANYNGKSVPVFVFGGLPPAFRAFLISLMGACFSSFCSIQILKKKPKIARFCYVLAVLFMVATLAIAFCATVWEMYKAFPPTFG